MTNSLHGRNALARIAANEGKFTVLNSEQGSWMSAHDAALLELGHLLRPRPFSFRLGPLVKPLQALPKRVTRLFRRAVRKVADRGLRAPAFGGNARLRVAELAKLRDE